jgi:hypothetical protein
VAGAGSGHLLGEPGALARRTTGERVLRRLAGAGVAVLVAGVLLGWTWFAHIVMVGAVVTYVVGVPLSLWLERRTLDEPGVLGRHLVAGLWAGGLVGFATYPPGFLVSATIGAGVGAGVGAAVAVVSAAAGTHLPRRALWPAALVGPLVLALVAYPVWQETRRTSASFDQVPVVEEPVLDAEAVASHFADRVEARAAAGDDRLSDEVWTEVVERTVRDRDVDMTSTTVSLLLDDDGELPVSQATGERVRLVTVEVQRPSSWRASRWACLQVTDESTEVLPGACVEVVPTLGP